MRDVVIEELGAASSHVPVHIGVPLVAVSAQVRVLKITLWMQEKKEESDTNLIRNLRFFQACLCLGVWGAEPQWSVSRYAHIDHSVIVNSRRIYMCAGTHPGSIRGLCGFQRWPRCSHRWVQVYLRWRPNQQHMLSNSLQQPPLWSHTGWHHRARAKV